MRFSHFNVNVLIYDNDYIHVCLSLDGETLSFALLNKQINGCYETVPF